MNSAIHVATLNRLPNPVNMAVNFASVHANLISQMSLDTERKDWEAFQRKAHSLKSNANWIGALHCSETAKTLEAVLAAREPVKLVTRLHARLDLQLKLVFERISEIEKAAQGGDGEL